MSIIYKEIVTFKFVNRMYEEGLFANAVVPPAVLSGESTVRTSFMATHEDKHLNRVLDILAKLGKEFNLTNSQNFGQIDGYSERSTRVSL